MRVHGCRLASSPSHIAGDNMPTRVVRKTFLGIGFLFLFACVDQPTAPTNDPLRTSAQVSPFTSELLSSQWQERTRTFVRLNAIGPLPAIRIYAAVSVAQYRAVQAVDRQIDTEGASPAQGFEAGGRARYEAHRGAISAASASVLGYFFAGAASAFLAQVDTDGAAGPGETHPGFAAGVAAGTAVGDAMRLHLNNDGNALPWAGALPVGAGYWTGTPVAAHLGGVTPYLVNSTSQFRPAAHVAFGSPAFNAALAEVLTVAQNRTPQQIATAQYWASQVGAGASLPGHFNLLASNYIEETNLDERAATRVFALLHAAQFDAALTCFEAKYHYALLRPNQANPAITLIIGQPSYPAYPSGHACFMSSGAAVLKHFFPQHTTTLDGQVLEAALSRLYGGIHYMFDMEASWVLGRGVAGWALAHEDRL
jgi:membrane-associated phospholipid phosphatase